MGSRVEIDVDVFFFRETVGFLESKENGYGDFHDALLDKCLYTDFLTVEQITTERHMGCDGESYMTGVQLKRKNCFWICSDYFIMCVHPLTVTILSLCRGALFKSKGHVGLRAPKVTR